MLCVLSETRPVACELVFRTRSERHVRVHVEALAQVFLFQFVYGLVLSAGIRMLSSEISKT